MEIVEMAKQIEGKGGRLYLVGGAVRDKYMNIETIIDPIIAPFMFPKPPMTTPANALSCRVESVVETK